MLVPIADEWHSRVEAWVALRSSTPCLSNSLVTKVGKLRLEGKWLAKGTLLGV